MAKTSQNAKDRTSTRRGWNCLREEALAAYLDGNLGPATRAKVESHLANCEYCCGIVADVIRLQGSSPPDLPASLLRSAAALGSAKSGRSRWIFIPAAATAAAVLMVVALALRNSEQPAVTAPRAPAAPLIAKSEPMPAPTLRPPVAGVVRNSTPGETLPQVVSPKQDKVVARDALTFKWKPVSRVKYYELHVVTPEGGLVWEGQSEVAALKLPMDVTLYAGPYFVWITAYLDDGSVQKSEPVRFLVRAR